MLKNNPVLLFLWRLYARHVSVGDRLGETFYAVWMAVISIGLLNTVKVITPDFILHVIAIAFSVNIVWGLIDGITAMYTAIIDRARSDRLLYALRTGSDPDVAAKVMAELGESIAGDLADADKQRIIAALAALPSGPDPRTQKYRPGRDDLLYALGIFLIDVGLLIPVILPLLLIHDVETAIYASRLVATAIFASLGWAYARHLNRNPWIAAAILGGLGFALFTGAYAAGS